MFPLMLINTFTKFIYVNNAFNVLHNYIYEKEKWWWSVVCGTYLKSFLAGRFLKHYYSKLMEKYKTAFKPKIARESKNSVLPFSNLFLMMKSSFNVQQLKSGKIFQKIATRHHLSTHHYYYYYGFLILNWQITMFFSEKKQSRK